MTTLDINGQHVTVDDSFLSLSPDQQQATVDHIASQLGPKAPELYTQAGERASGVAALRGIPIVGAYADKLAAAINAGAQPFTETGLSHADNFSDRMAENEKTIKDTTDAFEKANPIGTTVGKMVLGGAAMVPAVAAAPELLGATGGLGTRMVAGGLSNAALGGADAAIRNGDPVSGAIVGGLIGAGAPAAEAALSPFTSAVMAHIRPQAVAERQVARAVAESGRPTADIASDVTTAAAEGQPQFTLADALGNSGQRMLSTVARAPGEGRTAVVDALNSRQAGQGDRIIDALEQGFGSRMTPAQLESNMTAARGAQADAEYGAVRNDAAPVDLSAALDHIDQTLSPGVHSFAGSSNIANDSVESALQGFRNRITDGQSMLSDFTATQRLRGDLSDAVQRAVRAGEGNKARLLGGVLRQVDTAMENASAGHLAANRNFSQASRDIEAIGQGRQAAGRGRTADVLSDFNSLQPRGQQAFRTGFVDPLIAKVDASAPGVNKARPLLNDRFRDIADATAPGAPLLQRQLGREQTMFETRNQALGGSRTMDNINDHEALGINPSTVMHAATGNWTGAIGSMIHAGVRGITGNTPAVRKAVADILLKNGANLNPAQLNAMVTKTIGQIQFLQQLARGTAASAAVTTNANQANRKPSIFVTR
jgi:hypothetical protein